MMKFTSETPHFFKVILEKCIRDGTIMVPKPFVLKHGSGIPSHVQLSVPTGELWSVKWKNREGEVWFTKGWKAFADYYSIRFGHFLIFRYKGDGIFDVAICDTTASEIEYPIDTTRATKSIIKNVTSKYPYFKTVLNEVHFTGRYCVLVPAHIRKRVNKTDMMVMLHVEGRSWPMRYKNYDRECILTSGWKLFAEENSLRVGDECVFQHIPDKDDFNVVIIRTVS